ncbi:hypothetical protein J6590_006106 [Homalodisca vitripennis]|nr:hypothetical protein J6590_006106 [Homalodisca vitripennis]
MFEARRLCQGSVLSIIPDRGQSSQTSALVQISGSNSGPSYHASIECLLPAGGPAERLPPSLMSPLTSAWCRRRGSLRTLQSLKAPDAVLQQHRPGEHA